jgi:hypothetical protein
MNPETIETVSLTAGPADTGSEPSSTPTGSEVAFGVWTRDIQELCRALDAQQRAHFRRTPAEQE